MIDKRTRLTGNLQFKTQHSGSSVEIDGKTIVKDEEGKLKTAVGGFIDDTGNIHKIDSDFIDFSIADEDIFCCLVEEKILCAVTDATGAVLVDENNKILLM